MTFGFVAGRERARIYFGDGYREYVDVEAGDFVHVPPNVPHIEGNLSKEEPMEWRTARTPENIVVNLGVDGREIHDLERARAASGDAG